jgi:hypothetical protein
MVEPSQAGLAILPSGCAPDVYFPLEITAREYSGALLMATELASRGLNAVVGNKSQVAMAMASASRPGILFYKGGYKPGTRQRLGDLAAASVGIDPEAGLSFTRFSDFFEQRPALHDLSRTAAQFCYGLDDFDLLREKHPDSSSRIHLTGAPRTMLWGSAGDSYYKEPVERILDRFGSVVLFAVGGIDGRGESGGRQQVELKAILDLASEAAAASDREVIVRPHPKHDVSQYRQLLRARPNLSIEGTGDLAAWVRASVVVVHSGRSTSALEAVCAGRPAISMAAVEPSPRGVAHLVSHRPLATEAALDLVLAACRSELPVIPDESARALIARKLLEPATSAPERIADVIERFPIMGPSGLRRGLFRRSRFTRVRVPSRQAAKERVIPGGQVERDVERFAGMLGHRARPRVRKLSPDCFVISS